MYIADDGEEYVDMSIPVVDIDKITGFSYAKLNQDYNGRLDMAVWKEVAHNMDVIDTVMYANHIFNPFSVKDGDIIFVPNDSDAIYDRKPEPSLPDGTKHSQKLKGDKPKSYAERVEDMARQGLGIK